MTNANINFEVPGTVYQGFKVLKSTRIAELQCTLRELVHVQSGALIMHIANDDPENLFCLSFQTLPQKSDGIAHILEHTVLCGSKKYPVKDPFFSMTRRSLNTFMNALTGADFTCYPAATQEPKDFYNLLEVYLDAVFHPFLNELSFLQEGCRLELAVPSDPNSPLEYKGIVFNEMKGALAPASARLAEAMNKALFPDITYGNNSGGDPKVIPSLTYAELLEFHKRYYHPSRCLFFFYGNMPLEGHLDFIAEHALKDVEPLPPLPPIPKQPRFNEPKRLHLNYPISDEEDTEDKALMAFGWLTCPLIEQEEILALSVIEIILMDTDASPLKRALLNSGLVKQASSYIESDYSEVPWVIGVRGANAEDADKIEATIYETLENIVKEGIPQESIDNALHRMEFFRSEITGDHAPFGLGLFMRSALLKQHGASPENGLMIHTLFDELRADLELDPNYLTKLIKRYLLENKHFVRVVMSPDQTLGAKEIEEEKSALAEIRKKMTPQDIQNVIQKAEELAKFQKMQEDENCDILPKIGLNDVTREIRSFCLKKEEVGNLNVYYHETFTNEIVYADLVFNLPPIAEEDLPLVRLFALLLSQVGAGGRDYIENLEFIQAHVGSISAALSINIQATDYNAYTPSLQIRGKALYRKADKLMQLIQDLALTVDFGDKNRLKELVLKHYTGLQSSLNQSALKYAVNLSGSRINEPGKIINDWYGLSYFYAIKEIAQNWDEKCDGLVAKLTEFKNTLLNRGKPDLIITCSRLMYEQLKNHKFYGLQNIETLDAIKWKSNYSLPSVSNVGKTIASPIAFIGKVFATIPYIHPDAAALNIASFLFDNVVLHARIREQGGAYGGGSVSNTVSGIFYFYSYRDPNIVSTLSAFEDAIQEIVQGEFDESDLEEAKLEMIQSLDTPVSPGSRGELAYGWLREGKTPELRQKFRDSVLGLTKKDVIDAVKRHIADKLNTGATIVFAGKELLEKENTRLVHLRKEPLHIGQV